MSGDHAEYSATVPPRLQPAIPILPIRESCCNAERVLKASTSIIEWVTES